MTLRLQELDGAYNGLQTKIDFIKKCFERSLTDIRLRRFSEEAAGRGTRYQQAENLFKAIREAMVYIPDPVGVELTKSPSKMMDEIIMRGTAYGDCDDYACLSFTLLKLIGIPAKLRVIWKWPATMPRHIYTVAVLNGQEVAFDTAARLSPMGHEISYNQKVDFS